MHIVMGNRTSARLPSLGLPHLERAARRLLRLPLKTEATFTVVSDGAMRALNRRTRNIDRTTDVLSFPLHGRRPYLPDPDGMVRLGDIVVALPTARRQAQAAGRTLRDELQQLLVHGLLHLLGFDHVLPRQAARMERRTVTLLRQMHPRSQ
jgi:probable rRNA maturation factor